jgi:hypothetical protein
VHWTVRTSQVSLSENHLLKKVTVEVGQSPCIVGVCLSHWRCRERSGYPMLGRMGLTFKVEPNERAWDPSSAGYLMTYACPRVSRIMELHFSFQYVENYNSAGPLTYNICDWRSRNVRCLTRFGPGVAGIKLQAEISSHPPKPTTIPVISPTRPTYRRTLDTPQRPLGWVSLG